MNKRNMGNARMETSGPNSSKQQDVKTSGKTLGSRTSSKSKRANKAQRKVLVGQKTNVREFTDHHKELSKEINYKRDKSARPPYSYAALICLAMMDVKSKVTLEQIYKWIKYNFAYYRNAGRRWQVSIVKQHLSDKYLTFRLKVYRN